jgi:hypothetical protein
VALRYRRALLAAVVAASACLAPEARATAVGITFTATDGSGTVGSDTISAAPGDLLTATVSLTADAAGVRVYGISTAFDVGPEFDDELDLVSATPIPTQPFENIFGCGTTVESALGGPAGSIPNCSAGAGPGDPGPVAQTIPILELVFRVTANVATDGFDIETGLFTVGFDGIFANNGDDLGPTTVFGKAAVNLPEPSAGPAIALGVIVVLHARRRSWIRPPSSGPRAPSVQQPRWSRTNSARWAGAIHGISTRS